MKFRIHLTNPAIFAMLWLALSALVLHDIMLRRAAPPMTVSNDAVSERIVTKEFVLVDDNGNTRARIGMNDQTNAPSVQLFDAQGQQRAQLRLNKNDVPSLRLYDNMGNVKSVMGFTLNDMQPSYVTFDNAGVGHVENATRAGMSWMPVRDEDLMSKYGLNFGSCIGSCNTGTAYNGCYTDTASAQALAAQVQCEVAQAQAAEAQARAAAAQVQAVVQANADMERANALRNAPQPARDPFRLTR